MKTMKFEMWTWYHVLYILSPFIIMTIFYYALKNKSEKTKYIVGIVLGGLSIATILTRNIDIWVRSGFGHEVLPMQVCHFGNIVAGLALITKNKSLLVMAFCFNLIPAFSSLIFADSLAGYDTFFKIRAQAYFWGHLLIVVCAVYGILIYKPKVTRKHLLTAIGITLSLLAVAIILNPLFRHAFSWNSNYFYIYNSNGVPFEFIYNLGSMTVWGWFSINFVYAFSLLILFSGAFVGLYYLTKYITKTKGAIKE